MHSIIPGPVEAPFDALTAALDGVADVDFQALTTEQRLVLLERLEVIRRRLPAIEHPLVNQIVAESDAEELGGKPAWALADRLLITRAEARRRISEAADLGPRQTLTGQQLEPVLPATAAGQRDGKIGAGQIAVIRQFWRQLPGDTDIDTKENAEADLASRATENRPDELHNLAICLYNCLNPDGTLSEDERARKRGLVIGRQGTDGMSSIKGWLDPQARATIDAWLARWAAPGMCNPADETPCLDGTPSQAAIEDDHRGAAQRNHDALTALGRAMLASGDLGQHNGLPATIIISVGLNELEKAIGKAHTGGGTWLPMADVIRMASHSHMWLRIFDKAKEVKLYHKRRIASPGQRIVLYARDRGCTHPNCTVPGYLTEAHHTEDFAQCPETDIHGLTLRCGPHHRLIHPGGWSTRTREDGLVETIPPPHLDHGRPRINFYHHPEKLLLRHSKDDDTDP